MYDISSRPSFLTVEKWFNEAKANTAEGVVIYLVRPVLPILFRRTNKQTDTNHQVGSKLDKTERAPGSGGRAVSTEEGRALAEALGAAGFCEASAKTCENVRRPFIEVVDRIVQSPGLLAAIKSGRAPGTVVVDGRSGPGGGGGGYMPGCFC